MYPSDIPHLGAASPPYPPPRLEQDFASRLASFVQSACRNPGRQRTRRDGRGPALLEGPINGHLRRGQREVWREKGGRPPRELLSGKRIFPPFSLPYEEERPGLGSTLPASG